MILNSGGDRHERLRRLVMPVFRPGDIDALRPRMREQIAVVIDALMSSPDEPISSDVVATIADPYPIAVLADVLGIPDDERAAVRQWTTDLGLVFGFHGAAYLERIEAGLLGLYGVADRLIGERRRTAGDDLVSRLVRAEDGGDRLNEEELRNLVVTMLFAGHDTTKHQLALGLHTLTQYPSAWELLAANPDLAVTATEEVMRVVPTVSVVSRIAIEDLTYSDLELPAGTFVQLFTGIANRDPLIFGDASFDITATRPRPLAFGGGLHHCVGHLLARAELEEALPALAAAFTDLRVGGTVKWRPPIGIVGPSALPLTFRRRVPAGS
jgi:cytochrome P450